MPLPDLLKGIPLPNNCILGKISISPKNWQLNNAPLKQHWTIDYRFYDNNLKRGQRFNKRVEKHYVTLKQRQDYVRNYIKDLYTKLENGFNPILEDYVKEPDEIPENSTYTFKSALQYTCRTMKVEHETQIDIESVLRYIYSAMKSLGFSDLPIEHISRKHIKQTLEETGRLKVLTDIPIGKTGKTRKGIWNANQFNHSRKYLHKLFEDMIELELIENNPVHKIRKQEETQPIRRQCTEEELERIDKHLRENYPEFWRYYMIFRYSGSRIIETLRIKKEHIELSDHQFKILVKKGRKSKWVPKTIRPEVDEHWEYLYNLAKPDEYIFSRGLLPGPNKIRREQITRRWEEHIKKKLNIPADIYSLKHSNLEDIAEKTLAAQEALRMAQVAAGHSSPVITEKHYLKGQKRREHELLRKITMN